MGPTILESFDVNRPIFLKRCGAKKLRRREPSKQAEKPIAIYRRQHTSTKYTPVGIKIYSMLSVPVCQLHKSHDIRFTTSKVELCFNPLKPELIPICYLLALLAHHFLHVSRIRVKSLTIRLLMSYIYIYGAPILDVSRSHTTTQHSR